MTLTIRPKDDMVEWTRKRCKQCRAQRTMPKSGHVCGQCLYPKPKETYEPTIFFLHNLKAVMERQGVTITLLTEQVKLDPKTVYSLRKVKHKAQSRTVEALADALCVSTQELY